MSNPIIKVNSIVNKPLDVGPPPPIGFIKINQNQKTLRNH